MHKFVFPMTAALFILTACTSADSRNVVVTQYDKQAVMTIGQMLTVKLPGNITTGFSWYLVQMPDLLEQIGEEEYVPMQSQMVGAGGISIWRFKAFASGTDTLRFIYKRSWEADVLPARTVDYIVTVFP